MPTVDEIRANAAAALEQTQATNANPDAQIASLQEQLKQALQVISQLAAPTQVEAPAPVAKLYYSNTPFILLHVSRGPGQVSPVQFVAGRYETADPVEQAELEKLCKIPGTGFSDIPPVESEDVLAMRADVMGDAERAQAKMIAAGLATG